MSFLSRILPVLVKTSTKPCAVLVTWPRLGEGIADCAHRHCARLLTVFTAFPCRSSMSSLKLLNQDAENAKRFVALAMNINAAKGLQEVLKTNLGPKVIPVPRAWPTSLFLQNVICFRPICGWFQTEVR